MVLGVVPVLGLVPVGTQWILTARHLSTTSVLSVAVVAALVAMAVVATVTAKVAVAPLDQEGLLVPMAVGRLVLAAPLVAHLVPVAVERVERVARLEII